MDAGLTFGPWLRAVSARPRIRHRTDAAAFECLGRLGIEDARVRRRRACWFEHDITVGIEFEAVALGVVAEH